MSNDHYSDISNSIIEIQGMNYCCGTSEIGGFEDLEEKLTSTYHTKIPLDRVRDHAKMVRIIAKEIRNSMRQGNQNNGSTRGHAFTATTTTSQKAAAAALKQCKFRPVKRFRNANSGNRVILWVK